MHKYRIKKVVDGNGNSTYYPQIKTWYGWKSLYYNKHLLSYSYSADAEVAIRKHYNQWLSTQIKSIEYTYINICDEK